MDRSDQCIALAGQCHWHAGIPGEAYGWADEIYWTSHCLSARRERPGHVGRGVQSFNNVHKGRWKGSRLVRVAFLEKVVHTRLYPFFVCVVADFLMTDEDTPSFCSSERISMKRASICISISIRISPRLELRLMGHQSVVYISES